MTVRAYVLLTTKSINYAPLLPNEDARFYPLLLAEIMTPHK